MILSSSTANHLVHSALAALTQHLLHALYYWPISHTRVTILKKVSQMLQLSIFFFFSFPTRQNNMKYQPQKDNKSSTNSKFTRNRGSKESIPPSAGKIKKKIRDTQRTISKVTQKQWNKVYCITTQVALYTNHLERFTCRRYYTSQETLACVGIWFGRKDHWRSWAWQCLKIPQGQAFR